jgi:phosphoenolpyruvate-protein phosphotransferase (PTS system enzyme I)
VNEGSDPPNRSRSSRPSSVPASSGQPPLVLEGIAGSPGMAIGAAVVVDTGKPGVVRRHVPKHVAHDEMKRFDRAVTMAAQGLREVNERVRTTAPRAESSILEAYVAMIEDETLREDIERRVKIDRQCVEWAVDAAIGEMARQLKSGGDPYLAERSHDLEFIGDLLLRTLTGRQRSLSVPDLGEPAIVVAHDLSPAETAGLSRDRVLAMVTEIGTRTSHTAILARSLEIPAVVGVTGILSHVGAGDRLIVDGQRGRVVINPTPEMIEAAQARAERHRVLAQGLREQSARPATTKCGVPISLRANIELPSEAEIALSEGAQGIGLYRTEFLYVNRALPPSEEEQYQTYKSVLERVGPLPVTLRTFDIGGDKFSSAFPAPPEMNPALGLRAVRLGLARPDIFLEQLRAMVRASAHGQLMIMVPMIAAVQELRAVRGLLDRAVKEVDKAGQSRAEKIPLGVMVEVPAAAIMADELAREAEFLSIGTNDLIQYTLAVDRTSRELAYLASPYDPALLRLIRGVIEAGRRHRRPVTVCGAMASDPLPALLLIGMGLRELSMESSALPEVKEAISRVSLAEAEAAARQALEAVTTDDVAAGMAAAFHARLSDLLGNDDLPSGTSH